MRLVHPKCQETARSKGTHKRTLSATLWDRCAPQWAASQKTPTSFPVSWTTPPHPGTPESEMWPDIPPHTAETVVTVLPRTQTHTRPTPHPGIALCGCLHLLCVRRWGCYSRKPVPKPRSVCVLTLQHQLGCPRELGPAWLQPPDCWAPALVFSPTGSCTSTCDFILWPVRQSSACTPVPLRLPARTATCPEFRDTLLESNTLTAF